MIFALNKAVGISSSVEFEISMKLGVTLPGRLCIVDAKEKSSFNDLTQS